jgi:hypothetical protein
MVGPPLDNWSTEDVTAIVCKFGRLLAWENDATNKGRIIAKVRCSELRDIPKSTRLTEGEGPGADSWTFSIEILQQTLIGGSPQDEDPIPPKGVDPHALPPVPFHQQQPEAPVEDMDWGDGHWAMENQANNMGAVNEPINQDENAVDMEEDLQQTADNIHGHSSVTLSVPCPMVYSLPMFMLSMQILVKMK